MSSMFSVTPSQIIPMVDHLTSRVNARGEEKPMSSIFIWGAPGIGKTSLVNTIATSRKSRNVVLILSQSDPTDLKGIPIRNDDGSVSWVPTSYLPQQYKSFGADGPIMLDWKYAEDVAVYGFKDGVEVFRYNDPVMSNADTEKLGKVTITHVDNGKWAVEFDKSVPSDIEVVVVDKSIVFLDELSTAEPSVQNAALQLVLDRRVGEYDIPHGVPVIAAGNREDDGAFVQTLSHPLCNRFVHLTLVPSVDDFIEWGMYANVRPEVLGYVKAYPDGLFKYEPDSLTNGSYGFPTPRSWKFLSDQYEDAKFFHGMAADAKTGEMMRMALFTGIIGQTEASRFVAYLQVMHDLPSVHDIVAGKAAPIKNVERSKTFGLLYSMIQQMGVYYKKYYDDKLDADNQPKEWCEARDNILNYISDNYERESGSWAAAMLFQKLQIKTKALRSDAMMRFAKRHVDVMTGTFTMSR